MRPLIAYYRVNSLRDAPAASGIDAQRETIARFAATEGFNIVAEFADFDEIEAQSGGDVLERRPQLVAALAKARATGKKCPLAVAKLDRLSRDVEFIASLIRKRVPFIACESGLSAESFIMERFTVKRQRELFAEKSSTALTAGPRQGKGGGNPRIDEARAISSARLKADADMFAFSIAPAIREAQASGATTLGQIAKALNSRGIATARGGQWHGTTVAGVLNRIGADSELTREIFFQNRAQLTFSPSGKHA